MKYFLSLFFFFPLVFIVGCSVENLKYTALTDGSVKVKITDKCEKMGGEMIVTGCGIVGCAAECEMPYKDAGKNCQNSDECSGYCELYEPSLIPEVIGEGLENTIKGCIESNLKESSKYFCNKNQDYINAYKILSTCIGKNRSLYDCSNLELKGKCTAFPLESCEAVWQLNGSSIKLTTDGCSL